MARFLRISALTLCLLPLAGCLFRSHEVERVRTSTVELQSATQQQLIQSLAYSAARIRTLNATVDISPAVGGSKRGKVTEYTDVRGYLLARKPDLLRMIGLFPVMRNRAFDMVSDGQNFRVSIPPKNKFIVGRNDLTYPSQTGLTALRPQHIFGALLLAPVDPMSEIAVLEDSVETLVDAKTHRQVQEPDYVLTIAAHDAEGWRLSRKVYFSREDLEPVRLVLYDQNGSVETDAHYSQYENYSGIAFPDHITIDRPQEEYSIVLKVVTAKFNAAISDAQFRLEQPPGSQLVRLDLPPGQPAATADPHPSGPTPPAPESAAAQPPQ